MLYPIASVTARLMEDFADEFDVFGAGVLVVAYPTQSPQFTRSCA